MTGGENRRRSILKALRKRRLDREVTWYSESSTHGLFNNLHQYSKNKIHCSCPLCSCKTNNKGGRAGHCWAPARNYKISDLRKLQKIEYSED